MAIDGATLLPMLAALVAAGGMAGLLAGLLGIGGGIIMVPVLFHVFEAFGIDPGVAMHVAVATSLATIAPTALSSARAHHRRGGVDPGLLRAWAPWLVAGAVAGVVFASLVRGGVLAGIFGAVALFVAFNMATSGETRAVWRRLPGGWGDRGIAGMIGAIAATVGIGGGALSVPILSACSYPMRRAVGTSAAIGLLIAIPGAIAFAISGWDVAGRPPLSLGYVNLLGLAALVPATVLAAPWGVRLAHAVRPLWLKRIFAVFLAITAVRMLARAFSGA